MSWDTSRSQLLSFGIITKSTHCMAKSNEPYLRNHRCCPANHYPNYPQLRGERQKGVPTPGRCTAYSVEGVTLTCSGLCRRSPDRRILHHNLLLRMLNDGPQHGTVGLEVDPPFPN